MKGFTLGLAAALIVCASAGSASAQALYSAEVDRGLRYRNTTPYDGMPTTQRYSNSMGPNFYFSGNSYQTRYLDYLDRADRAQKFGYAMPLDPYFEHLLPPEMSTPATTTPPEPRRYFFRRFR